jgi:hypothetical protein
MTQAREIINTLGNLGVTIHVQGEDLVLAPKSKVPPALVPEIRQRKAEILSLICQPEKPVGDGQLPPLDRPPTNEMELRRLIDYLDDPVAFAEWFEELMGQADPAKREIATDEE